MGDERLEKHGDSESSQLLETGRSIQGENKANAKVQDQIWLKIT